MARKANRNVESEPQPAESIEQNSDHELDESIASDVRHQTMTKAGAARAALANGIMVPRQASAYIKQKYDIDISPQQFSAEKSRLKLRSGGSIPASGSNSSGYSGENFSGQFSTFSGEADLLQALEIMKPLIHQLGADKVKRMVDLLD